MNENHWYPRDPMKYLTDTMHMDAVAECAYNRLLEYYYATGRPLPNDDGKLQRIGKVKDQDWARVRGELLAMGFKIEGQLLRHRVCDQVLAEMREKREKRFRQTEAARLAASQTESVTETVTSPVIAPVTGSVNPSVTDVQLQLQVQSDVQRQKQRQLERINDERSTINLRARARRRRPPRNRSSSNRSKEKELMGQLIELLGKDEMARAGGNWRTNWARKQPELLERGLAELAVCIKEGKAIDNRGAWLMDLLKRWE